MKFILCLFLLPLCQIVSVEFNAALEMEQKNTMMESWTQELNCKLVNVQLIFQLHHDSRRVVLTAWKLRDSQTAVLCNGFCYKNIVGAHELYSSN